MDKEYIEAKDLDDFRDELMDKFLSLCNYNDYNKITLLRIGETVDKIYDKYYSKPLSDAVAVVRCKDCKHNVSNWQHDELDITDYTDIVCDYFMTDGMNGDDYCSYGERKDATDNDR